MTTKTDKFVYGKGEMEITMPKPKRNVKKASQKGKK